MSIERGIKSLRDNLMSFAMPLALFKEMESNLEGSFIEGDAWEQLRSLSGEELPPTKTGFVSVNVSSL